VTEEHIPVRFSCPGIVRPEQIGKKVRRKAKKKLVLKHLRTTSWFMTVWKDLIWTRTTQTATVKKMSSEGWKRQSRQLNHHFMNGE
jgi:hypothetical protein